MILLIAIGLVVCVICSAFFSASEMSFSSANKIRLENAMEEGDAQAKKAFEITEHYDDALSTILVGNNLVNVAASSLATVLVILLLGQGYTWVATLSTTILIIIFGETIPKILAKNHSNQYALRFAGSIRFLMVLLKPVTWIVVHFVDLFTRGLHGEKVVEEDVAVEELHSIIALAEDEEILDEDSSELVSAAIDFAEISVSEVMTARVDILAIDVEDDWEDMMKVVEESPYSRIPVYEDSIDNVIGILSLNHFLKACIDREKVDIRELLMQPYFVYKTMKLPAVLSTLRDSQQHLAIVTDEYGGTLGVVTLEDILEELVGEIWDETDEVEDEIKELSTGVYEFDGDTPITELMELMEWDEIDFDYESDTVGGWCIEMLGQFPKKNQSFDYRNLKVQIVEVEERRVTRVKMIVMDGKE